MDFPLLSTVKIKMINDAILNRRTPLSNYVLTAIIFSKQG